MLRCRTDEVRQFIGVLLQIFFIKNPFREPAEESRHSIFENFATRAKNTGSGINLASEWNKIMLISAGTVQKEQGSHRTTGHEFVNEIEPRFHFLVGTLIGGRISSIWDRVGSSHGGRRKLLPNSSGLSSEAKPGESVAISKSTPPGSRKYIE